MPLTIDWEAVSVYRGSPKMPKGPQRTAKDLTQWVYLLQRGLLCGECEGRIRARPGQICLCCLGTWIPPIPLSELGK